MTTISMLGQELKIVCGVPRAPGDVNSAEDALQILDLLAGSQGFSVEPGGWIPGLPQLKKGGIWGDSTLTDGRTLLSAPVGNVTESLTLTSHAATLQGRYFWEKELSRFGRLCADFWQTFGQIQPVYLKWWAPDAPGPQYALLYKIELAGRGDPFSGDSVQEIVVSLEREPGWRGIAPGDNPKKWTFEFRQEKYTMADLSLAVASRDLVSQNINNRREWNAAHTAVLSQNYMDIPAASIPGDMPALACIVFDTTVLAYHPDRLWVSQSSKPTALTQKNGLIRQAVKILNAGDSALGTDATKVNDALAPISNGSGTQGTRVTVSFATVATYDDRIHWDNNNSNTVIDGNSLRGAYMVYLRARQSGGSAGDCKAQLIIRPSHTSGLDTITGPEVSMQIGGGDWVLHYMGQFNFPMNGRAINGPDGRGLLIPDVGNGEVFLDITVSAKRTTGASTLLLSDLIFLPIDETAFIAIESTSSSGITDHYVLDNTDYQSRGRGASAIYWSAGPGAPEQDLLGDLLEMRGQGITLAPGVDNRIYFLSEHSSAAPIAMAYTARLNLVPRWSGIRDV